MTLRDYTANVISASKVVPDGNFKTSKASGVWDINEALDLIKGGNWPNAENLDPATFVDGLFSIDLYEGNATARTITTNIDVSNNGGLVWIKARNSSEQEHNLYDTVRGAGERLISHATSTESTETQTLKSFTSSGFTLGTSNMANQNGKDFVAWTWRKHPKFFDVVTYTGTGSAQAIAHNLGSVPGMIIIKSTDVAYNWGVFHRSLGNTKALILDATNAEDTGSSYWNNTDPTSTHFTVGSDNTTNASDGGTYVAYLFAHNNSDGGFGEPEDQDIIKCGTFTNSGSGIEVNLGFEPQFMMFKRTDSSGNWGVVDVMRSTPRLVTSAGDNSDQLRWNLANAENAEYHPFPTPTGFKAVGAAGGGGGGSGTFVYMAIRRGGMQTPTTASDVFAIDGETDTSPTPPTYNSGFPVDLGLFRRNVSSSDSWYVFDRLRGNTQGLITNTNDAEQNLGGAVYALDRNDGVGTYTGTSYPNAYAWMWKRARGYFDMASYTGTGSVRTVSHNLGAVPEMIWVKRTDSGGSWGVWHEDLTSGYYLGLDTDDAQLSNSNVWTTTDPTATQFSVGSQGFTNASGGTFIAYLFATVAGVSKVGSFTYAGASGATNVDCGFTSGSKFVIFKRTDSSGDWYVVDSTRGITSGNDPYLRLNLNNAQNTSTELINQLDAGFTVQQYQGVADGTYIFYAIAA